MRLSTIRNLYGGAGPWASVYLDATGMQKTGTPRESRRELDLHWRAARETLQRAGADEATLKAMDRAILDAPSMVGPAEVAVLASHGAVALRRTLPVRPDREAVTWSPEPHAADLLRAAGLADEVRWVRADLDRTGGAITSHDGRTTNVRGEDEFVTKTATAGNSRWWSAPRDQRAAEQNWDQNSAEVVRAITAMAQSADADVVILAGDVRARQLVRDHLPVGLEGCVVEVDHEVPVRPDPESRLRARRQPDVHDPALDVATRNAVESVAQQRRAELAERFHSGLSVGTSVRGLGPVCEAARELRIDTLVLSTDPSRRFAWVDRFNPTMVGESKDETGTESAVQEPADDALVGACAVAGAESIVIEADADLVDGLGAILRYPGEPQRPWRAGSHERRTGGPVIG